MQARRVRRVVITGLGAITPLGKNLADTWDGLLAGQSGIGLIKSFEARDFIPSYAGEVKSFRPEQYFEKRTVLRLASRHTQLAMAAALMGVDDAALTDYDLEPERFGIVFGAGMLRENFAENGKIAQQARGEDGHFDLRAFGTLATAKLSPLWLLRHIPNLICSHIAIRLNAQGPSNTITTACTAGAQAIIEAARIIERGEADVMVTGGADARIEPLSLVRLRRLGLLATCPREPQEVSRPFDVESSGFVCAEGAGALVLEDRAHAEARGARIYAELIGYGVTNDTYDLVFPHPEGRGLQIAMARALKKARITPEAINYLSAHGASVPRFDLAEARALRTVFGKYSTRIRGSAIKSMLGHTQTACGAIEAAASVKTLTESIAPPTINLRQPAPECEFDWIANKARPLNAEIAMSVNFGLGGHNTALIFQRGDSDCQSTTN